MLCAQVICPSVPHQSERLEPAQALSLDVDKGTLGAALDFYTKGELLEGDNQYYCEAVGTKVTRCRLALSASLNPAGSDMQPVPLSPSSQRMCKDAAQENTSAHKEGSCMLGSASVRGSS